jgi:phosphoenolpyruvate-protein phosphotransferase (PTS system enzyme I)
LEKNKHKKASLQIRGIAASAGISVGKAFVIKQKEIPLTGILLNNENDITKEIEKFKTAVQTSVDEIESLKRNTSLKNEEFEILETHIEFLTDPQISDDVIEKIKTEKKNANDAVIEVIDNAVEMFDGMKDEYMSARAADVQDIGNRILKNINSSPTDNIIFEPNTIIIAEDISPSDTIMMDINKIIGFATEVGGKTSHTAILAKSKGIPAVIGCGSGLQDIENNNVIIVDGVEGLIIINPSDNLVNEYKIKQEAFNNQTSLLKSLKNISATTTDGTEIKLSANISNADEMEESFNYGAEGVGLFRTELLFMNRNSFPSEEEQFQFYKKVAIKSKNKPVIVRTIDIGGDKQLSYFGLPDEENPFLGYRAIRICLDQKEIFITQLKAILRAGKSGNFKIMFPMICNVQELRMAKEILEEAKKELKNKNIEFAENMPVGIMIEIPSAAITADILAKEADFFSIGTNDLCQYTLAVDRGNEKIKDLYDPYNPALLRLISYVIEQAHKHKIKVGMCGELASDPLATLLLMGMGLQEFSMSAVSIPSIKNIIINSSHLHAKEIFLNVMQMDNSKNIISYLQQIKK